MRPKRYVPYNTDALTLKEETEYINKTEALKRIAEEHKRNKDTSILEKIRSLKEEVSGVSEALDEVPSDIVKKWLRELDQIESQYAKVQDIESSRTRRAYFF